VSWNGFVLWLSGNVKNVIRDLFPWFDVPFYLLIKLPMCFKKKNILKEQNTTLEFEESNLKAK